MVRSRFLLRESLAPLLRRISDAYGDEIVKVLFFSENCKNISHVIPRLLVKWPNESRENKNKYDDSKYYNFLGGFRVLDWYPKLLFLSIQNNIKAKTICNLNVKCDAIKQNESELEKNKNTIFICITHSDIRPILCWKPDQNWAYDSRDIAILVRFKTMKYKGNLMLLLALSKNQY